jgi:hypothetical protein
VKLAQFTKTKATCFFSNVEYKPNTNPSNIMKTRLHYGEVIYKRGRVKKEVKKMNMVDILFIQE